MYNIRHSAALVMAAGLVISACGGGYGVDTAITPPPAVDPLTVVPVSAATSVDALVSYLLTLVTLNAQAETREPIDVSAIALVQSDTTEPATLP